MSIDALQTALEAIDERTWCQGTFAPTERLALALPDGDVGAIDDPKFVEWLLAHSEVAPFGEGGVTKTDPKVRDARRILGRGAIQVAGFEPAAVLAQIEKAFSTPVHLEATLLDILVYPVGGHFARHKDTPRSRDLVGTLIVELPLAHTGGAFHLDDGTGEQVFDWSERPETGQVRWLAMFSDVDHRIAPVQSGTRATLVYSLAQTQHQRTDAEASGRVTQLRRAAEQLVIEREPLLIACTRHVITDEPARAMSIDVLRGSDRQIADELVKAGFLISVRPCMAGSEDSEPARFPAELAFNVVRLRRPLPPEVLGNLGELVSFAEDPDGEEYEIPVEEITVLAPYVLDDTYRATWIVRPTAVATAIQHAHYSMSGYFGNEAGYGFLYTLAAIEVTRRLPN